MKRSIATILVLFGLMAVATIAAPTATAQGLGPFYWDFINVDIDVQENGDMLITETQKYVFTSNYTNERCRWIPLDKVDAIGDVQVSEEGNILSATTGVKNNQLWVKWTHALSPPESHTFVLKYRVIGGLHVYDDGDQVY